MKIYYTGIRQYYLIAALLWTSLITVYARHVAIGGNLTFQVVSYDCNSGVLQYQFTSSDNSPVSVSIPGVFGGTINPNSVATYTFPGDGRTGRTITGTASQSGTQISISYTNGCGSTPPPSNPPTNPPSSGDLAFQIVSYDCNSGVLQYQFTGGNGSAINVSIPGVYGGSATANTVLSYTFPPDGRQGRTVTGSATQSGTTVNINFTNGCNMPTNPNPPSNPPTNPPSNPYPIPSAPNNFVGYLDQASCTVIKGWVANMNDKARSAKFDVYLNGWLVARNQPTTKVRQDVANYIGSAGFNQFGFQFSVPSYYRRGVPLTVSVKYAGTSTHLTGSPMTMTACQQPNNAITNDQISPDCDVNIARILPGGEQAIATTFKARTGLATLQLSSNKVSSLTSKLLPVKKGELFRLSAYVSTPDLKKRNLAPQLTTALVGGAVTGLMLTQSRNNTGETSRATHLLPAAGVSTLTLMPLARTLLANRLPRAAVHLAYYDQKGRFKHRQKVMIDEAARAGWQRLVLEEFAEEDGYVSFRLENKSKASVLFDDLSVERDGTPFISEKVNLGKNESKFAAYVNTSVPENVIVNRWVDCPTSTGGALIDWGINFLDIDVNVIAPAPTYGYTGGAIVIVTGSGGTSSVYTPAPGDNWGGNTESESDGGGSSDSIMVPTGAPKNPTTGTQFVSPYTGEQYVYDGSKWVVVLPTVRVQGTPPANPAESTTYYFLGVLYTYQYGGWTVPYKGPNNAIEPEIVVSPCQAYKRMLALQQEQTKEIVAIGTTSGKFFILPFTGNTEYESITSNEYRDEYNRIVIKITEEPIGSCNWVLSYYDYSLKPNDPEFSEYQITGHYHTHPDGSGMDIPSEKDEKFRQNSYCNMPKQIVNNRRLVDYTNPNATPTITRLKTLCP